MMVEKKPKPKRLYQVWRGSNRFFCGGRLIFGPDVASLVLSIILVAGPALSFCIKVYHVIDQKKKADQDVGYWYAVLVLGSVLTGLSYSSLSSGCLAIWNIFTSRVMFPKDSFMSPFLQLLRALAVARKGLPRIKGILEVVLTTDESIVMEPTGPNLGATSKEKIDIEMGTKLAEASGLSLPEILQNLDYDDLEDNLKSKENGKVDSHSYMFPVEPRDSMQTSIAEHGPNAEEKCDEATSTPETKTVLQV